MLTCGFSRKPTADIYDLKQNVIGAYPEWSRGYYVTCGTDRAMKVRTRNRLHLKRSFRFLFHVLAKSKTCSSKKMYSLPPIFILPLNVDTEQLPKYSILARRSNLPMEC